MQSNGAVFVALLREKMQLLNYRREYGTTKAEATSVT